MTIDALGSTEVSLIRRAVPEFEMSFQRELREEDGQMGAFQALSLLAEWVRTRLAVSADDDAASRAFQAVEQLIADENLQLGDALAAEFIEGIWDDPRATELMGPLTRARARPAQ